MYYLFKLFRLPGILLFFLGCSSVPEGTPANWQEISARNVANSLHRPAIYHAQVPVGWERIDPDPDHSLEDTTKPICEYLIHEGSIKARITIHTFPIVPSGPRIPPIAQINRWKSQFQELDPLSVCIYPESHGGFSGLGLTAEGVYQNEQVTMMAWSMVLAQEFVAKLELHGNALDRYKLADFTIKIVGNSKLIEINRVDIMRFFKSFELIDELPQP